MGIFKFKKSQHLKNSAYLQIYPFTRGWQIQQILTEVGKHLPIMQLNHSTVIRTVASTFWLKVEICHFCIFMVKYGQNNIKCLPNLNYYISVLWRQESPTIAGQIHTMLSSERHTVYLRTARLLCAKEDSMWPRCPAQSAAIRCNRIVYWKTEGNIWDLLISQVGM